MRELSLEQVDDFQMTFLSKMRAFHTEDVLLPLSQGSTDPEIFKIIETEALSIVRGMA